MKAKKYSNELTFELPKTAIKDIPLFYNNQKLSIGFIEIGCKHRSKRSQLTNKKELFYKFWGDNYKTKGVDWYPEIYRTLVHYNQDFNPITFTKKYLLNHTISCKYVTELMLDYLEQDDKSKIFKTVRKKSSLKEDLEDLIENKEKDKIHHMIVNNNRDTSLAILRGTFAELLMLNEIYSSTPHDMYLFRNGQIHYMNKRYTNGTEIDGITLFHGKEPYFQLIESLKKKEHLDIKEDKLICDFEVL
jgi:hypothetical protein